MSHLTIFGILGRGSMNQGLRNGGFRWAVLTVLFPLALLGSRVPAHVLLAPAAPVHESTGEPDPCPTSEESVTLSEVREFRRTLRAFTSFLYPVPSSTVRSAISLDPEARRHRLDPTDQINLPIQC